MGNILKTRIQQLVDVHKSEAENKKLMKGELAVELTDASGSALDYPLIKVGVDDKITSYDELNYVNKLEVEDKTGVSKTEVAVVKYNNTTKSIYAPKITYEVDDSLSTTHKTIIGTLNSGDTAIEVYIPTVTAKAVLSTGTKIASINVGDRTTNVYTDVNRQYVDDNMMHKSWSTDEATLDSLKKCLLDIVYPVGSIYMSAKSTSPAKFLGGTWVRWGQGRVPVGVNEQDADFKTAEKQDGKKTQIVSGVNSHTHTYTPSGRLTELKFTGIPRQTNENNTPHRHTVTILNSGEHSHSITVPAVTSIQPVFKGTGQAELGSKDVKFTLSTLTTTNGGGGHIHAIRVENDSNAHWHNYEPAGNVSGSFEGTTGTTDSAGEKSTVSVLQPYITCYMWKRVE